VRWGITLPMSLGALVMNPLDCDRGSERAVSTSFQTLTLLTMVQLRNLVRITSGR